MIKYTFLPKLFLIILIMTIMTRSDGKRASVKKLFNGIIKLSIVHFVMRENDSNRARVK